jgi:GNAT superfamily N-acetyltransferase
MPPEFRQFAVPDDFPRLVELKNAYLADFGRTTTEERQRFLLSLRDHDAAHDNRVVVHPEDPNWLIGHIWVWQQTQGRIVYDLVIHPDWQQQGLGSQLLQWAKQRAKALNATILMPRSMSRTWPRFASRRSTDFGHWEPICV